MDILFMGIKLSQDQIDAITPVINGRMIGRISNKKFDMACLEAMDKAGCPFIPDDEEDADAPA